VDQQGDAGSVDVKKKGRVSARKEVARV
jgi:hypothetical protein